MTEARSWGLLTLVRRALSHHWRLAGAAGAMVAVMTALFTSVSIAQESSVRAFADSVRTSYGGAGYALQVRDPDQALPALAETEGLRPIADTQGAVGASGRLIETEVRRTSSSGPALGAVIEGKAPDTPGELTVSPAVAEALGVKLGDEITVTFDDTEVKGTLVGLSVDPARANAEITHLVVDDIPAAQSTVWVTDVDPFQTSRLIPLFDDEALTFRTVELLAQEESEAASDRLFPAANMILLGASIATIWLLLFLLPVLSRSTRRDVEGLQASGMSSRMTRRFAYTCLGVTVGAGLVSGYLGAVLTGQLLGRHVGGLLDQVWLHVAVPLLNPLWFAAALAAGLAIAIALARSMSQERLTKSLSLSLWRGWVPVSATVSAVAVASIALTLAGWISVEWPLLLVAAAVLSAPPALTYLTQLSTRRHATRQALRALGGGVLVLTMMVAVISGLAGVYASRAVHDDRTSAALGGLGQPGGSLAVYQAPANQAQDLADLYAALGGAHQQLWTLPDETGLYLRATTVSLLECMVDRGIDDPFEATTECGVDDSGEIVTAFPIDLPVLDPEAESEATAAPELIEDSQVGLIVFDDRTGEVVDLAQTNDVASDRRLGGNLPGVVLAQDGRVANQFDLRPSGSRFLLFEDFGNLAPQEQAEFRGAVARLAGAAQIAEDNPRIQSLRTRVAWVVGFAAAAMVTLIMMFGGLLLFRAASPISSTMQLLGAPRSQRLAFGARLVAPLPAAAVVAACWGLALGWLVGIKDGLGYGAPWLFAPIAAILTAAVLTWWWTRLRYRVTD